MERLVTSTYIVSLFSLTFVLYIALKIGIKSIPELEIYVYILTAAALGSFWGAGMHEVSSFVNWSKYGKDFYSKFDWTKKGRRLDWYSEKAFLENLQYWKMYFIKSNIAFVIFGFVILPIINHIF
jgi:hypothetical protein